MTSLQYRDTDVIEFYKLSKARVNGTQLRACCPFQHYKPDRGHYYERNPSFGIDLSNGAWNCFSCQKKGHDLGSLSLELDLPIPEFFRSAPQTPRHESSDFQPAAYHLQVIQSYQSIAQEYLCSRGIKVSDEDANAFYLGASREGDVIYFPLHSKDGEFLGWMERRKEGEQRWNIRPYGIDKGKVLFGTQQVRARSGIVVESPIDVLRLRTWNYSALATCGAKVMDQQIELILDLFDTVYLVPHNDDAGKKWAQRLWRALYNRCFLYGINLPKTYKDVAEMEQREEFDFLVMHSKYLKEPPRIIPRKDA